MQSMAESPVPIQSPKMQKTMGMEPRAKLASKERTLYRRFWASQRRRRRSWLYITLRWQASSWKIRTKSEASVDVLHRLVEIENCPTLPISVEIHTPCVDLYDGKHKSRVVRCADYDPPDGETCWYNGDKKVAYSKSYQRKVARICRTN